MSGFTRITRKMGIVHYASLIVTMRHILYPLFKRYGALSIETEADNFFVVFPDAQVCAVCVCVCVCVCFVPAGVGTGGCRSPVASAASINRRRRSRVP